MVDLTNFAWVRGNVIPDSINTVDYATVSRHLPIPL